jgi:RNA-binding protein YhbY
MIGGAGVTPAVLAEVDSALKSHELIKIRMLGGNRDTRMQALQRICAALDAGPVQAVGRILVVYRPAPDPQPRPAPPAKPPPPRAGRRSRG